MDDGEVRTMTSINMLPFAPAKWLAPAEYTGYRRRTECGLTRSPSSTPSNTPSTRRAPEGTCLVQRACDSDDCREQEM